MPDLKEILLSKNVAVPEDYETFKNIFRHFKGKKVGDVQGDDGPLLSRADEFYLKPDTGSSFLQGDLLENIPSVWIQKDADGKLIALKSAASMAMVLSSECDCELRADQGHQSFIRLCPVLKQSELLEGYEKEKQADARGKLERNYYTEFFWMPSPSKADEPLVADLSHFYSVALPDLHSKTTYHKSNLNPYGQFLLYGFLESEDSHHGAHYRTQQL